MAQLDDRSRPLSAGGKTGLFELRDVTHEVGQGGGTGRIRAVLADCTSCRRTFEATEGAGLTPISGGAVISCLLCGQRQAIGQGVFDGLLKREKR